MVEDFCTIRTFTYHIVRPTGFRQTIFYDVQIPLPENSQPHDYYGNLMKQENVPLFAHQEVEAAFRDFIWENTQIVTAEHTSKLILKRLRECGNDTALFQEIGGINFQASNNDTNTSCCTNDDDDSNIDRCIPTFEDQFQKVMCSCTSTQLEYLIRKEIEMTQEMHKLVQARNSDLAHLEKACEDNLASSSQDLANFDMYSHQLSLLNTEIRQISNNYSYQVEILLKRQKRDYRDLVQRLFRNEPISMGNLPNIKIKHIKMVHSHSHSIGFGIVSSRASFKEVKNNNSNDMKEAAKFKKSISCDEKLSSAIGQREINSSRANHTESFSIYIGSQLKTMHNARILSCTHLSNLCLAQSSESKQNNNCDLFGSERLHLLMNLYGRELSAVVLIVNQDPYWHIRKRTKFALLCELSAELHFDSLETQLVKIEEQVRKANKGRRMRKGYTDMSQLSYSPPMSPNEYDENMLKTGDVYITRHSNLSAVQLVFHLVCDATMLEEDISSRHPCFCGLRNIVRLSARSAIRNISLPLLLIDHLDQFKVEIMSTSWYQSRAELVFKCLKGFLMEVCSNGSNNSIIAGASTMAAGGSAAQSLHFNINFALPSTIPANLFSHLVELFTNIYSLVPSFNA